MITITKKKLTVLLSLGLLVSILYFGSQTVSAQAGPMYDSLVAKISQKFNLKEEEVAAVFASVHDERMAQMKLERAERLAQAVSDGVITSSQKDYLLSKMEEHQGMRQAYRDEMHQWMESQGIDPLALRSYMGGGGRHR